MRKALRILTGLGLVGLAACNSPNVDQVEENAIVLEGDTRDAADQRAANLDRLAGDLDAEAKAAAGNGAAALRNEAATDRAAAAEVRSAGEAAAENIEDATEASVGVEQR